MGDECEGVEGATADFVCFHCPLLAPAGAKLKKRGNIAAPTPTFSSELRRLPACECGYFHPLQ